MLNTVTRNVDSFYKETDLKYIKGFFFSKNTFLKHEFMHNTVQKF